MDIVKNEKQAVNMGSGSNKKYFKILILIVILLAVIALGFYAWPKISQKLNKPKAVPENLIDQYKQDLSDLKKKAEKSGSKEDLQAYGIAQYATGDASGAEQTYKKQIEKEPTSVIAHGGLANAYRDEKKFDQAIEEYKKVIELAPTDISAYVNLASVYQYQLKQTVKAVEVYNQAIEKNSKSADLYVLLAIAYEQSGENDNAKKAYSNALGIDENNVAAKAGLERLVK